jgi:hypothetical protein
MVSVLVIVHNLLEGGPFVGSAEGAALESHAVNLEREPVQRAGRGDVGNDGHALRLQGVDELLHGLRTGGKGGIQDLLQLQAERQDARAQGRFDLAFLHLFALGQNDLAVTVTCVRCALGEGEAVHALKALNDSGADEVFIAAQIHRTGCTDARGQDVDMLALGVVMHHVAARMIGGESHALHVVVTQGFPAFWGQRFTRGQAQRVVPDGLANVGTQGANSSEFAAELAHVGAGHVAADQRAGFLFVCGIAPKHIVERATESAAALDAVHAFHVSVSWSISSSVSSSVLAARRVLRSARSTSRMSATLGRDAPENRAELRAAAI